MNADLKKIYNQYIYTFEEVYLASLKPNVKKNGQLINLTDYNNLKNIIEYSKSQRNINISADSSKIVNLKKLTPIKEIKLKTPRYLINMLCNDNEFILISPTLWKFIGEGKENDNQFPYTIDNNNKLVITFGDKQLTFKQNEKNKKNIINKQNIEYDINKNSNIKDINSFYKSINDYYTFEVKFINKLKQSNNKQEFGCLVEKIWFDKWLKYLNYKEIKEKYKKQIKEKEIKDDLIYNLEKNNYFKYSDLCPINIIFPETKKELESFLEKDSLVLVESNFCKSFTEKEMSDNLRYRAYNNKIEIVFKNGDFIAESSDNIISRISDDNEKNNKTISSDENKILIHLTQFIKYINFKDQINNEIKSSHKVLQKNEIDKNIIYLVNKDIINNYKTYFDYAKLYDLLNKNKSLKSADYFVNNFTNLDKELKNYLFEIKKKESIDFDGISNDLKERGYKDSSNQIIKYYIDFDIINKEFNSFLIENNIFKKEQTIKGIYIAGGNKILLYMERNDKFYYEIGYFDSNEDFIIEYIIKSRNKDAILNHFNGYGIDKVINNKKEGHIKLNNGDKIGYFYKIIESENKENNNQNKDSISNTNNNNKQSNQLKDKNNDTFNDSNDENDSNFIIDIFLILLSINSFENKIQNKSEIPKNNYLQKNDNQNKCLNNYFLINKKFFNDFKKLFNDDKVNKYLKKWENESLSKIKDNIIKTIKTTEFDKCKKFILNKRSNDIFKSDILEIDKEKFKSDWIEYYYPNNFNFLSQEVYSSILNVINKEKEESDKNLFLNIVLNKDKIYFQFNNKDIFNKSPFFIYEFSLINNTQFSMDYKFESLLVAPYKDNFIKYFKIINNKNNNITIRNNTIMFQNSEICKIITIPNQSEEKTENKKDKENISVSSQEGEDSEKINSFLNKVIALYKGYSNLEKKIKESTIKDKVQIGYYLVNKKFMEELEKALEYKKIVKLNENIFKVEKDDKKILEKVKGSLDKDIINKIKSLNEININIQKLEKIKYDKEKENNLFYYNNCSIINKEIWELINEINQDICQVETTAKCYLIGNEIWCRLDKSIINIGSKDKDNIYIVENIIFSKDNSQKIIEYILKNEYKDLEKYKYGYNLIKFEENKQYTINKIEGKIFNLLEEEFKVSDTLEILISLVANNIYIKSMSENIKNKKIFLLDNKIIEIFSEEFKELKKIFNENVNSKNNIDNIIIKSTNKSQLSINNIIFNLNKEKLKKLDEKILKSKKKIPLKENSEKLNVIDKNIIIYKDYIFVFEHIYDNIKKYFDNSINQQDINYSSHKNEDILTINTEEQNTILIGKLDSHNSSFDIKYIFEYNSYNLFDKEKNIILAGNINNYIENKTIFEKNKKEEYLSPIISENKLIGYCYIYKENKRYDKEFNFYNILSWDKIKNSINLYYNYKSIDEKLSKSKSRSERQTYYIINKNVIVDIKNNNDFKKIYELLEKNDINENDDNSNKSILLALKNLSEEELKSFKKQYNNKIKYSINDFSPNVNSAKYFEKVEKNIIIYNDFEIIRKDIIEKLIDNIKDMNSLLLECIFIDEKIIINYPDNLNGNKFVSVIGKLNYDKTFVTEYILIYNSRTDKQSHILSISNRLKNYLKGLQIYNNCDVITDSFFHEIGTIAKCDVNDYDYDDNNYNRGNYNSGNNDNNVYESSKNQNINIFNAKSTITRKTNKFSNVTKLENDYQLDFRPTFPHIRKNFNCCPKIGLQNIGATCYMNATLQCFCHIEKFLDYFKYSQKVKDITRNNKNSLTSSFKLLIENLWPNFQTSKKDYAPEEFKNKISKMNPLFKGVAANDAKDLVNFIIMTLHEELNSKTNNTTVTPFNNNMMMIQQTNQQVMLNNFVQNFQQSNDSMISGLFYGINCNITQCGFCKTQTYNYQTYFFIVFPLEEVRKFKINNLNNNYNNFQMNQLNFYNNQINYNNNINEVSLWDCFDYDWKINEMSGTNSMYCNYCKRTCTSQMRTVLTTGPRILILLLNRGKGIEFNVKINFTEQLNISKYLQFNNQGFLYQLIGVISHLGESGMGGHFIAYCRDPITGQWNKYNDSIVIVVDNFQNEVINFAMPYLLFYQQIDNNR